MSTAVEEGVSLEGFSLDDDVPCAVILITSDRTEYPCPRPGVIKVHITCNICGEKGTKYYCRECWEDMLAGRMDCYYCGSRDMIYRRI